MTKTATTLFLSFIFAACSGQEVKLSITNRSPSKIDSVVFPFVGEKPMEEIQPGETETSTIRFKPEQLQRDGSFPLHIYQNGRKYLASYAFHAWGELGKTKEEFYFFSNGINLKDSALQPPREFILHVDDMSKTKADSITVRPESLIKIYRDGLMKFVLDFETFSKNPVLMIYRSGSSKQIRIDRDWSNWNITEEIIYIDENGVARAKQK